MKLLQAPVTYARNCRTPMLIIHGGNDYRVDSSQGQSMFLVLQAKHLPSILLYFEAVNDWVLKPVDRVLWYHTASAIGLEQGLDPGRRSLARDRYGSATRLSTRVLIGRFGTSQPPN
jgi:Prolyl oligopeptidase family